jgi:Glucodextranase, domain B
MVALAVLFVVLVSPRIGAALSASGEDLGARFAEIFPQLQGTKPIDLPTGGGTVSGDIAAQNLPDFTRDPQLTLTGRLPAFAQGEGRTVEVTLEGALVATLTPDAGGAFATPLTLRDGPNAIALSLISGKDVLAHTSYTVVLDRQAPTLTVTTPLKDASVEGPNVSVAGKAEAGTTVTVDGRTVAIALDGSFTDTFTATPGAITITVTSRDRAGNETTVKTPITVKAPVTTAPLVVAVTLDKISVKPGAFVVATIRVTANGIPKSDELVTLQVGVITIGSARTSAAGSAVIVFAAPPNEGEASVVVLATGASGRATLTVAK